MTVDSSTSAPAEGGNGAGPLSSVTPIRIGSSASMSCRDLAAAHAPGATWFELKLDPNPVGAGPFHYTDGVLAVDISNATENLFNWTANRSVDAVFVKAGTTGHNLYVYDPEAASDTHLATPDKQAISHITFCYDVELLVSKTAETTFTRDYDWTIAASVSPASIALENGGQQNVGYSVKVTRDAGTDSDWAVSGTIAVTNPHPSLAASGIAVADSLSQHGGVAVTCPSTSLAPGASMTCSYAPVSPADGSARTNTATASSTTYGIVPGTGSAAVEFVTPTTVVDATVDVTDTYAGTLATDLASSHTYTYPRTILASELACGANTIGTTASLATDDGLTRTSGTTLAATLSCSTPPPPPPPPAPAPILAACALSQGYWSSHSSRGPAPYDSTWAALGEDAPFYSSGLTHYAQMLEDARGNAYNILAVQFIAAKLNMLTGAAAPAGISIGAIETFFATYTPAQIAALKGNDPLRKQALGWASTLDAYNNGRLNVSACAR